MPPPQNPTSYPFKCVSPSSFLPPHCSLLPPPLKPPPRAVALPFPSTLSPRGEPRRLCTPLLSGPCSPIRHRPPHRSPLSPSRRSKDEGENEKKHGRPFLKGTAMSDDTSLMAPPPRAHLPTRRRLSLSGCDGTPAFHYYCHAGFHNAASILVMDLFVHLLNVFFLRSTQIEVMIFFWWGWGAVFGIPMPPFNEAAVLF